MAETYTKPQTVDGTAGGDTVKNAIMNKIEVNAAGIVSDLNIHAALTTTAHGLDQALSTINPIGAVTMWPTETIPTGWFHCNGASLARTGVYANLFAVLGTLYGTVDATHFNVPDYRGHIPRAWDNARALDPDRATRTVPAIPGATITAGDHVGTEQADGFKSHTHGQVIGYGSGAVERPQTNPNTFSEAPAGITAATGGNETRPVNVYLMFIIRYA